MRRTETAETDDNMDFTEDDVNIPLEKAKCPQCGAKPTKESVTNVRLSEMGYKHGDAVLRCNECPKEWTHGIPVGEGDPFDSDLYCKSCADEWYRVHRVQPHIQIDWSEEEYEHTQIQLHVKCPNCYHFDRLQRSVDDRRIALVGFPMITGEIDGVEPYGYLKEDVE